MEEFLKPQLGEGGGIVGPKVSGNREYCCHLVTDQLLSLSVHCSEVYCQNLLALSDVREPLSLLLRQAT